MGSKSKAKKPWGKKSMKEIKQWCKARGIHPADHMARFPLIAGEYDIPAKPIIIIPSFWMKIKEFICRLFKLRK